MPKTGDRRLETGPRRIEAGTTLSRCSEGGEHVDGEEGESGHVGK